MGRLFRKFECHLLGILFRRRVSNSAQYVSSQFQLEFSASALQKKHIDTLASLNFDVTFSHRATRNELDTVNETRVRRIRISCHDSRRLETVLPKQRIRQQPSLQTKDQKRTQVPMKLNCTFEQVIRYRSVLLRLLQRVSPGTRRTISSSPLLYVFL